MMASNYENIDVLISRGVELLETEPQNAEAFIKDALGMARETQYPRGIAQALFHLAQINFSRNDFREALTLFHESLNLFIEQGNKTGQLQCFRDLGQLYYQLFDFEKAMENLLEGIKICKENHHPNCLAQMHFTIGNINKDIRDFPNAINQYKQALKIFQEQGNQHKVINALYMIGNTYNWADEYDVSLSYLKHALEEAEKSEDIGLIARTMGSLAILYTKLRRFDKALDHFMKALKFASQSGEIKLKADLLKSLGNLYIEKEDYDQAIIHLNEALTIATSAGLKMPSNLVHQFMSIAYEKKEDFKKSLHHYKQYSELMEEVNKEEINIKTRGLQLKIDIEEIKAQKELVERSVEMKDQFLANVSHEIRTPMNGVLGMINLMEETPLNSEQLEYVSAIKMSAHNLIAVINDILDISRINAGKLVISEEEFDLQDVLRRMITIMQIKADESKLKIKMVVADDVPAKLLGDPVRLNQVLLNLVNNAVKFTDNGSIVIEVILIERLSHSVKLMFNVVDTGIGIAEDTLSKIFESFTQASNTRERKYEGAGLGLTIVKNLVEVMNGKISVSSQINSGSTFKVELPFMLPVIEDEAIDTTDQPEVAKQKPMAENELGELYILLVEDNKVNQFLAKRVLLKMGFKTDVAQDAESALQKLRENQYDLILMDVQMPGMTGYELTSHIRKKLPAHIRNVPIIALTAYASSNEKDKALAAGMNDNLTKHYSPKELYAIVRKNMIGIKLHNGQNINANAPMHFDLLKHLHALVNGNIDDMINLLELFLEQVPETNARMQTALDNQDWPMMHDASHKIKSSLNIIGIEELRFPVERIHDNTLARENLDAVPGLCQQYFESCKKYIAILETELEKLRTQKVTTP